MLAGQTLGSLSVICGLSKQALNMYKQRIIKPAMRMAINMPAGSGLHSRIQDNVALTGDIIRTSLVRQRLEDIWTDTREITAKAKAASETTSDFAACATLLNQAHKNIEILGKLTGELTERPSGPSIAIQIVVPAGAQVPSFAPGPADDGITYDVTGEEIGIKTRS